MTQHFFITGLPRSRTAWLANWLTYGDSFCYHDELARVSSLGQLYDELRNTPTGHVGYSDPVIALGWRELMRVFPDAKWIVVLRSKAEVREACVKAFGVTEAGLDVSLDTWSAQLNQLCAATDHYAVAFDAINANALEIADYVGVDCGGQRRLDMLRDLQVQVHPDRLHSVLHQMRGAA